MAIVVTETWLSWRLWPS